VISLKDSFYDKAEALVGVYRDSERRWALSYHQHHYSRNFIGLWFCMSTSLICDTSVFFSFFFFPSLQLLKNSDVWPVSISTILRIQSQISILFVWLAQIFKLCRYDITTCVATSLSF
jgi:hypothetical protein